jgi:hypothetical protein
MFMENKHMKKTIINSVFAVVAMVAVSVATVAFAQVKDRTSEAKMSSKGAEVTISSVEEEEIVKHKSWSQVTSNAAWDVRFGQTSVVANNRIWIMGGYGNSGVKNDIWSSSVNSGSSWSMASTSTSNMWSPRATAASVVFGGKIWVMGGFDANFNGLSDVWRSNNNSASSWTQISSSTPWSARQGLAITAFRPSNNNSNRPGLMPEKMWISGGMANGNVWMNDVWSSTDGVSWTQVTANAPWTARRYHQMVSFNNKLWIIGGTDNQNTGLGDVWSSTDGANWTQVVANAPWTGRGQHQVVVANGYMWLTGGWSYANGTYFNDVWKSSNGINWNRVTAAAPWAGRSEHSSVFANGRLWIMAGGMNLPAYNDVWSISI